MRARWPAAVLLSCAGVAASSFLSGCEADALHPGSASAASGYTVRAHRACTLYASPQGSNDASGRSAQDPSSLDAAVRRTVPGSVVCLLRGTYALKSETFITRSGERGQPITIRSHGGRAVLRWAAPGSGTSLALIKLDHHVHDIAVVGLTLDGAGRASQGVKCSPGDHHLLVSGNTIRNTGSAGVATKRCDYVAVVRNRIYHTGYDPKAGWSSGVSLNSPASHDAAPGFHSFIVDNVISGAADESFHHSEGHGIILDLGGDRAPPALIAGNVVYENGSHCINVFQVTGAWVVNNTCYANGLDLRQRYAGEIAVASTETARTHFINNVAYAWDGRPPYQQFGRVHATYRHNVEYGGTRSELPARALGDRSQVWRVNPRFAAPPGLNPSAGGQYRRAVPPWRLRGRLVPRASSPLVDAGVDPLAGPGLSSALRRGMRQYLARDLRGVARPSGGRWDVGAYEVRRRR